jgi:hypothetical protein
MFTLFNTKTNSGLVIPLATTVDDCYKVIMQYFPFAWDKDRTAKNWDIAETSRVKSWGTITVIEIM